MLSSATNFLCKISTTIDTVSNVKNLTIPQAQNQIKNSEEDIIMKLFFDNHAINIHTNTPKSKNKTLESNKKIYIKYPYTKCQKMSETTPNQTITSHDSLVT